MDQTLINRSFQASNAEYAEFQQAAKNEGRSLSAQIRYMLQALVDQQKAQGKSFD